MFDSLLRPAVKPMCGRCHRPVDEATSLSIVVKGQAGKRMTYSCHGETRVHEIDVQWYDKLQAEKKPFNEYEFDPLPEPVSPTTAETFREDAVLRLREQRKLVAEFVETTIKGVVESQKTFSGDVSKFCSDTSLRLETVYSDLLDHSTDIRQLVIGVRTVLGHFELPFFPDSDVMKWVPTPLPDKKVKP